MSASPPTSHLRASHLRGALERLNARHPWSHNDHFHPWIEQNLPVRREHALDVGCGRGELVATLAGHFRTVRGIDRDEEMRRQATARCAGLPNVIIDGAPLELQAGSFDLITMVAVLHHLDLDQAFTRVDSLLAPGGRYLVVGLARPVTIADRLWATASAVTSPLIGWAKNPWPVSAPAPADLFPTKDPEQTLGEITEAARRLLPGAVIRQHLGFRYTLRWTKPVGTGADI